MDLGNEELVASVYGTLYESAETQMRILSDAIKAREGQGFSTEEECAKWAHEHHLDILVYVGMSSSFMHVSGIGETLSKTAWRAYFAQTVLFTWAKKGKGDAAVNIRVPWVPQDLKYFNNAKFDGELETAGRKPLFYRDYTRPYGFYDAERDAFNHAIPFPCFAKETGADISHILAYIMHISGGEENEENEEFGGCFWHLLAWLRTKMCNPHKKTEIVPIFASRVQGTGKSTFADVICRGMFAEKNVVIATNFDANNRFNTDIADALVISIEEKSEDDKRTDVSMLKSLSTSPTVRKEQKGRDPYYQNSYTEYIITTNKDVPVKFDGPESQRRFMVMGADDTFTELPPDGQPRQPINDLAVEVFDKLYGRNGHVGFVNNPDQISQFKHYLFTDEKIASTNIKDFPKTALYRQCQTLPRTSENADIEAIMRTLAPFIKESLLQKRIVDNITIDGEVIPIDEVVATKNLFIYMSAGVDTPVDYVAICKNLVFYDRNTGKYYAHSTVERTIVSCKLWLLQDYGISLLGQGPVPGGFKGIKGLNNAGNRSSDAARFTLHDTFVANNLHMNVPKIGVPVALMTERAGARLRVNSQWAPDPTGEFETVNEMPINATLENKSAKVLYMDTFLFESDAILEKSWYTIEQDRLRKAKEKGEPIKAGVLYQERLTLQSRVCTKLINKMAFRIVYSGAKSYHILVRVGDSPSNLDEYKWLHAHLCTSGVISDILEFDPKCNDPARLTRAPITRERKTYVDGVEIIGVQTLFAERNKRAWDYQWRPLYVEWLNRPPEKWETNGRKLLPCKQEYKDAMWALLNGTFWTDGVFNGSRQQLFFPAYRLLRLEGYAHDTLWGDGGILDGIDKYYRSGERQYWRDRETCALIKEIDADVERDGN